MNLATLWSFTNNAYAVLLGIVGIGFLIGFHELGHFLFCKLFGIRTPTFSIGFGPKLFSKKIGDTEFSLSAIPLGGYVEIAGSSEMMQGEQQHAHSAEPDSFAVKPFYQKILVMFGGILFNFLLAYIVCCGAGVLGVYVPKPTATIQKVKVDSPAERAGLLSGDTITAINGIPYNDLATSEQLAAFCGQTVPVEIKRNNALQVIPVTLNKSVADGLLGIEKFEDINWFSSENSSVIQAIKEGISLTNFMIYKTVQSFTHMFAKRDFSKVGGPIVLISETIKQAVRGYGDFFIFLAIISVNLAVLNLIPLPILDGGQILFCIIEFIIRRPLSIRVKEYIHIISWILILILILYLSFFDILRIARSFLSKAQ